MALPRLEARPSDSLEGKAVRKGLTHKSGLKTPLHAANSVLHLPDDATQYSLGSSRQTLRRKARAATKAGVTWMRVDDRAERARLIDLSVQRERNHPLADYRWDDPDNSRLLDYRLWLVAYGADGRPLLLCAVPYDGEWSAIAYFRTFEDSTQASDTRYLMSQVLVEHLVLLGVRYLADTASPIGLPNGLRHFQRMIGYRIVRVALKQPPRR